MKKLSVSLAVLGLLFSAHAFSAETGRSVLPDKRPVQQPSEYKPHVGLLFGAAQPEGSGQASSEIGVDIGYQPYVPFGLGVEYTHARIDDGTDKKDRDTVLAKGTYNFGGTIAVLKDSYVGVALGPVFTSEHTSFAGAPIAGFDIPLKRDQSQYLSLGAAAKYAIVSDNDVDTFSLTGVVKYWY